MPCVAREMPPLVGRRRSLALLSKSSSLSKAEPLLVFYSEGRNLRTIVHGDELETLGPAPNLVWLATQLRARWILSERGILEPLGVPNTTQCIRRLSQSITWTREGIAWEPDPRHVDVVV